MQGGTETLKWDFTREGKGEDARGKGGNAGE